MILNCLLHFIIHEMYKAINMTLYSLTTKVWHLPNSFEKFKQELKELVKEVVKNKKPNANKLVVEFNLDIDYEYVHINIEPYHPNELDHIIGYEYAYIYDIKTDVLELLANKNENRLKRTYRKVIDLWSGGTMNAIRFDFEHLPNTYEEFLETLKQELQSKTDDPQVLKIYVCFYDKTLTIFPVIMTPELATRTYHCQKNLVLFYSPSLNEIIVPFNVVDRQKYEQCIRLYYQLIVLLRHEDPTLINTIFEMCMGLRLYRISEYVSLDTTYERLKKSVAFLQQLVNDHTYQAFKRRLGELRCSL